MDHTTDTQTDGLYFGLTQAIGDHEPQYPGLSRMPYSSVTADIGCYYHSTEQQQVFLRHIEDGQV